MLAFIWLLLASVYAVAAGPISRIELDRDWLDATNELTTARFERLLSIADQDSIGRTRIDEAVRMLKLERRSDLFPYFKICNGEYSEINGKSHTFSEVDFNWLSIDEILGLKKYQYTPAEGAIVSKIRLSKDYAFIYKFKRDPKNVWVCLKAGKSLLETYGTLIHELNHLMRLDPSKGLDVLSYKNDDDFADHDMNNIGDEVESYIAGFGAVIRVAGLDALDPKEVRPYFSAGGTFLGSKKDFTNYLLTEGKYSYVKRSAYLTNLGYRLKYDRILLGLLPRGVLVRQEFLRTVSSQDTIRIRAAQESIDRLNAEAQVLVKEISQIDDIVVAHLKKNIERLTKKD